MAQGSMCAKSHIDRRVLIRAKPHGADAPTIAYLHAMRVLVVRVPRRWGRRSDIKPTVGIAWYVHNLLFFVDETWQEIEDAELKGKNCFANRAFRTRREQRQSKLLDAAEELFALLQRHHAKTFVTWTTDPALVSLRSAQTTDLSRAYKALLFDFRALMRRTNGANRLGSLSFDQRDLGSDEAATCALQNYLVRTRGDWSEHFITVPSFTVSAVSPGLQAADLVAHLGAHFAAPDARPELQPFLERVESLKHQWGHGRQGRNSIRQVRA
jgi:hypothetical protein